MQGFMSYDKPSTAHPPAEIYDEMFVPALFRQWGPVVAQAAGITAGQHVLDVGCGTGALTGAAVEIAGAGGSVTGLDPNPAMLAVARRKDWPVEWREGVAETLPFPDAHFDSVVSQFAMMFFEDKPKALREMMRVLRLGGRFAVAVCDAVENSPGYHAFALLLDRLFGVEIGNAFRAPFSLGNADALKAICLEAGLPDARITRHDGAVSFCSIASLVSTERACAWTLGGVLNDDQFTQLLEEAQTALEPFVGPDGIVTFNMPVLIVTAEKPADTASGGV